LTFASLHTVKGFLTSVGMLSCWVVLILFFLNWFFPPITSVTCINAEGITGLAVRGRGVNVAVTVTDTNGNILYWQDRATELTCRDTFGEGWNVHVND